MNEPNTPRAYALINGKYRHVYIVETYEQLDILGGQ